MSVKDVKLNFHLMKSHDCHVLMIILLPVALRGIKTVKDMKLNFHLMKSHDCHVLMITLLPVALRGIKIVEVTNICNGPR